MVKFYKGNTTIIGGVEYTLIGEPPGGRGFQFRTHFAKDKKNRKFVIKMTRKPQLFMKEISIYNYLKNKGYPARYFPRILNWGQVYLKTDTRFKRTRFLGFVMRYYKALTLEQWLNKFGSVRNPKKIKSEKKRKVLKRIKYKIKKRISKLHNLGVIHNDLYNKKNILIREGKKGRLGILILDFGLSNIKEDFKFEDKFEKKKKKEDKRMERLINRWLRV